MAYSRCHVLLQVSGVYPAEAHRRRTGSWCDAASLDRVPRVTGPLARALDPPQPSMTRGYRVSPLLIPQRQRMCDYWQCHPQYSGDPCQDLCLSLWDTCESLEYELYGTLYQSLQRLSPWAVPDAGKFLLWTIDENQRVLRS